MSKILNVGCGAFSYCDVNTDLFIGKNIHSPQIIKPKKLKNFVKSDGQYLPFKDNCFDLVYSGHVIEHVNNPFLFLKELIRVSKNRVLIKCPHRLGDKFYQLITRKKNKVHLHYFSKKWFTLSCKELNCVILEGDYSRFINYPLVNFIPHELTIEMMKK